MKPLSQQLADLSVRAKTAEERITAAQAEARERVNARGDQIERDVEGALNRVQQGFSDAKDGVKSRFGALQSKVSSDFQGLKDRIARKKRETDARFAEDYAEDMTYEAVVAIDYAMAAIGIAELAALDAIVAREQSETDVTTAAPTLA